MRINIVHLGVEKFFDHKSDIIYPLFSALTEIGHNTSISHNHIDRSALNILIGSDIICGDPSYLIHYWTVVRIMQYLRLKILMGIQLIFEKF